MICKQDTLSTPSIAITTQAQTHLVPDEIVTSGHATREGDGLVVALLHEIFLEPSVALSRLLANLSELEPFDLGGVRRCA